MVLRMWDTLGRSMMKRSQDVGQYWSRQCHEDGGLGDHDAETVLKHVHESLPDCLIFVLGANRAG